jgi:hypothetical protein
MPQTADLQAGGGGGIVVVVVVVVLVLTAGTVLGGACVVPCSFARQAVSVPVTRARPRSARERVARIMADARVRGS